MALQGSSCLTLLLLPLLHLHTSEGIKCYKCIGPVSHCTALTSMQCTAPPSLKLNRLFYFLATKYCKLISEMWTLPTFTHTTQWFRSV